MSCSFLASVFSVMFFLEPSSKAAMRVTSMAMAAASTSECFRVAGYPNCTAMPVDAFIAWYKPAALASTPLALPSLLELRRLTYLTTCNVVDVADVFNHGEDLPGCRISRASFCECMQQFRTGEDDAAVASALPASSDPVVARLFNVLDVDGVGSVCRRALMPALLLLCGGSRGEKLKLVYETLTYVCGCGCVAVAVAVWLWLRLCVAERGVTMLRGFITQE